MSVLGKMPNVVRMPALPADVQGDPLFTGTLGPSELVATDPGVNSYALARTQDGALAVDGSVQGSIPGRNIDDFITVVPRGENPLQVQQAGFDPFTTMLWGAYILGGATVAAIAIVAAKRVGGWMIDKLFRQSHDVHSARDAFCEMVLDYNRVKDGNRVTRFFKKTYIVARGLSATAWRAVGIKRSKAADHKSKADAVVEAHWRNTYDNLVKVERLGGRIAEKFGASPTRERPQPDLRLTEVYGDRREQMPEFLKARIYDEKRLGLVQYRNVVGTVIRRFYNALVGIQIPEGTGSTDMQRITEGVQITREQSELYLELLQALRDANDGLKTILNALGKGYPVDLDVDREWFSVIRNAVPAIEATLEFLNPRQDRLDEAVETQSRPRPTDVHQFSTVERLLNSVLKVSSKPAQFKGVELILDAEMLELIGSIEIPSNVQQILHEALTTIVDNAIAHSSPRLRFDGAQAEIATCTGDEGRKLYITVTDNGIGIDSLERVRAGESPLGEILRIIDKQDGISIEYKALTSLTRGHYGTKFTITVELPVEEDSYGGFPDQDSMPAWVSRGGVDVD